MESFQTLNATHMTKPFFSFLSLCFVLISLIGCQNKTAKKESGLQIISSFSILSEMAQEVGKDSVRVHNLVPVGTDPHEYQLTPQDIKFATSADLFLYNGLNLEGGETGWFAKMIQSLDLDQNKVFSATKDVTPKYLSKKGKKEVNPHAFIDPNVGLIMVQNIRDALVSIDPKNAEYYLENAKTYSDSLRTIEKKYRQKFATIPKEDRVFIASEQAFQYLLEQYDFKEGFIWAIDTEENGSPEQIKKAINFVKKNEPKVLFVESNVDPRPMETVSKGTGVPIYHPAIYSDELGKPGQEADTYLKYLRYNLKHIFNGLGPISEKSAQK